MGLNVTAAHLQTALPDSADEFIDFRPLFLGFLVRMPKFLLMATVDFQPSPDYPKTPAQEEKWRVGIIQNVLSDVIQVWYRENGVEKQAKFMVNQPRLDARDEAKEERALPFVGPPEGIGSDPFVNVIYGGSSRYPFYDDISDGSLCKNRSGEGPYELITNDQPRFFISSNLGNMPSTGRDPILEVRREMQFKLWVVAVRAADVAFANRYQVLAHVHPFTISCWFTRRNPSSAPDIPLAWFDPVDVAKNTAVGQSKGIVFIRSLAESRSTPLPVVTGELSVVEPRNFLKQNRLAR